MRVCWKVNVFLFHHWKRHLLLVGGLAKKVFEEIESGLLIDPATKAQERIRGDGALTLTDRDRLLE
jgi:hypothetical protein